MDNCILLTNQTSIVPSDKALAKKTYILTEEVLYPIIPDGVNGTFELLINGKKTSIHLQIHNRNGKKSIEINRGFLNNDNNAPSLGKLIKVGKAKKMLQRYKNGTTLPTNHTKSVAPPGSSNASKCTPASLHLNEHLELHPLKKGKATRINIGDYVSYHLDDFSCKEELEAFTTGDFDCFEVIDDQHASTTEVVVLDERGHYDNPTLYFLVKAGQHVAFEKSLENFFQKASLSDAVNPDILRMKCRMCGGKGCVHCVS